MLVGLDGKYIHCADGDLKWFGREKYLLKSEFNLE